MKTFTFGRIHGGSTTPENGFLSPVSLRRSILDAPTILLRGYQIATISYTNDNGHGPGHHHQQSHSVGGTTAATSSLLFPPNVDFHTS